ncbi:MAG: PcfJ domain-containing protein [Patescibacteria group bacterium]|nr:PcfJ domain-containing protein [Patescibacteria group bacterium]
MGWQLESNWHMAADVRRLALEQLEDLLGTDEVYRGTAELENELIHEGHKPPRPDIAKLKDYRELAHKARSETKWQGWQPVDVPPDEGTKQQWQDMSEMNADERDAAQVYNWAVSMSSTDEGGNRIGQDPFDFAVSILDGQAPEWQRKMWHALGERGAFLKDLDPIYTPEEAKNNLSSAIRKNNIKGAPRRYDDIVTLLRTLYNRAPETYKLWPWVVKQIKNNGGDPRINGYLGYSPSHMLDILLDAGKEINTMRQENRLPTNFDINKMDWQQFEDWWQQWKKDNRAAEEQGEVVYKFDDDWTIQRLTTPEQLQYEGDEMGHCVGGYEYANHAATGQDQIYSLRDPKGEPHITIEIEGNKVEGTGHGPNDTWKEPEYYGPHAVQERPAKPGTKTPNEVFDVVQIQGKGNNAYPEERYTKRIREWFDSLRQQGVDLQWTPDGQYNRPNGDYEEIAKPSDLTQFYSEFNDNPERYFGSGRMDEYGMPFFPTKVEGSDDIIEDVAEQLYREATDDRYRFRDYHYGVDPEEAARQVYYHLTAINVGASNEVKQPYIEGLRKEIEKLRHQWEDKLNENWLQYGEPQSYVPYEPDDEDWDEDAYYEARGQEEAEWRREGGYDAPLDFLYYLDLLLHHHGIPQMEDLPHNTKPAPAFTNMSGQSFERFPSFGEMRALGYGQSGTFSSWRTAAILWEKEATMFDQYKLEADWSGWEIIDAAGDVFFESGWKDGPFPDSYYTPDDMIRDVMAEHGWSEDQAQRLLEWAVREAPRQLGIELWGDENVSSFIQRHWHGDE